MHEMSVVTSLLSIVREEMEKHDVHRLLLVRVRYGALSNIVPEALSFAFEALTAGTDFEGAVLETEEVPITLKCSQCGHTFPAVKGEHFFAPCPACRGGIKELIVEIPVLRNVLEANGKLAASLKDQFAKHGILALNLISSPGAGKTSLLERTLTDLASEFRMAVIEGDLQTDNDARRVAATGAKAVQINTDGGCHLDSNLVMEALGAFDLNEIDILFIENVGNLVCPVEFDCGEDAKIALLSVTEGDDKPEKYPLLFNRASAMVLNKIDLLPYVDFDVEVAARHARHLNADLALFEVSCRTGEGLEKWYSWLRQAAKAKKGA